MSFNLLKFGLNLNKNNKFQQNAQEKIEEEITNKSIIFPDCSDLKKQILVLNKKIKITKNENISEKLKDKKLQILNENLATSKQALFDKLNLNSPQSDELDPLCSFMEIQK